MSTSYSSTVHTSTLHTLRLPGRVKAVYQGLMGAEPNRIVAPIGQPFAFRTHVGNVREINEDCVLTMGVRRRNGHEAFAFVVCDGMGGLRAGKEAAALAAASMTGIISSEEHLGPEVRLEKAIYAANHVVYQAFGGRSGAVVVSVLKEMGRTFVGWVGDARAYGLTPAQTFEKLTRDDTASELVRSAEGDDGLQGGELREELPEVLLQAVGIKAEVTPHLLEVDDALPVLVLMTDGVHRVAPGAMDWIALHARTASELAQRLVEGSLWEGGPDNATALILQQGPMTLPFDEAEGLTVWINETPYTWEMRTLDAHASGSAPSGEYPSGASLAGASPVVSSVHRSSRSSSPSEESKRHSRGKGR